MKQQKQNNSSEIPKSKKVVEKYSTFIKYSSLSTQMIVTLVICAYGGRYLDNVTEANGPYFTIGFLLFGLFASLMILYNGLREITKKKEK